MRNPTAMEEYFDEDEEERSKRRWRRDEALLVARLCDKIQFCSVKAAESTDRGLCFGSRGHRETLPVRHVYWDPKHSPNPLEEKNVKSSIPTNASIVPRFADPVSSNQIPAPNFYKIPEPNIRVWKFSKDLPRREEPRNHVPGPGTYHPPLSTLTNNNLPKIIACYTLCSPYLDAVCNSCHSAISGGDYYWSPTTTLCRICFAKQRRGLERDKGIVNRAKTAMHLASLKKVRNCDFYHQHLDTEKAVTHRESGRKCLKQKLRLENYLARFTGR